MITDRIGQHEVLLPINQDYDKIWERNWTSVVRFHIKKKKVAVNSRNARQQRAYMTRSVHLHRHHELTVLLSLSIISMTRTLSY